MMGSRSRVTHSTKSRLLSVRINLSVGYCWANTSNWAALRTFLKSVAAEASQRRESKALQTVTDDEEESEEEPAASSAHLGSVPIPRCQIRRLRASSGQFAWTDICNRIHESDVLIFDITPPKGKGKNRDNVLLELGYALAHHRNSAVPVIVVAANSSKHLKLTPTDLHGLILAGYAMPSRDGQRTVADGSLRSTLVQKIIRALDRAYRRQEEQAGSRA